MKLSFYCLEPVTEGGTEMFEMNRAQAEQVVMKCLDYARTEIQDHGIDIQGMYTSDLHKHCDHVAQLAVILGNAYGMNLHDLIQLGIGGYLHDIGKCEITGKFIREASGINTAGEFQAAQTHPSIGWRALQTYGFSRDVMDIILYHHERLDGSGYPLGRLDLDIKVQLTAVADTFDSVYCNVAQQEPRSRETVFALLRQEQGLNKAALSILEGLQNGRTEL